MDEDAHTGFMHDAVAPPMDEEDAWMQDIGSIMDINPEIDDEMELLRDLRNGYEDLQYARELEETREEPDAAPVVEGEEQAPTIAESDGKEEMDRPKKRVRYCKEQLAVLAREFDPGTARLSNLDIAGEIDGKPEGIGRKVEPDNVKNWMYAKARKARSQEHLCSLSGAGET
jgi:hypothetical protein